MMAEPTKIQYEDSGGLWAMTISGSQVVVVRNGESREYTIPERITNIKQDDEYVYCDAASGGFYQFKFEVGDSLIGDAFNGDGEHVGEFACYEFERTEDER